MLPPAGRNRGVPARRPEKQIPIACCRSGPFDHDTTLPTPLFPGLEPMRRLGAVSPKSDEALQFAGGLARQRNTVCYHLDNALATVQAMLAVLPQPRAIRQKHSAKNAATN